MTNSITKGKLTLLATVAPFAIILSTASASGQEAPAADNTTTSTAASASTDATQQNETNQVDQSKDVVVTGSIVRNPASATASPVVSLSSQDLANRGVTTVADALQLLTANNAGTAPPSWSSFGFATGASAPSLRGLNDAYTLTLFNGMRTAPYPLGDDGYRNFVDINTIPSSIVDRIDTLLDGASATYGSDAIAGVVNVIVKRQVVGLHLNASSAISERGDNGERRVSATAGYGDLDEQGFNVYINGEYQKNDPLFLRDRGYPFNTADQSGICGNADQGCLTNGIRNGIQDGGGYNGFQSTRVPFVRPYSITGVSQGGYQLLNPALGCQGLPSTTLSAAQRAGTITPTTVCQEDLVNEYRAYNSNIQRIGGNVRATAKVGADAEAFLMFNFYNTKTSSNNAGPQGFTGATTPPPAGTIATVSQILLPVYVCAGGVGTLTTIGALANTATGTGCTAANGTLNPNNPFAAQGQYARLVALPQVTRATSTNTKTYRVSGGINGSVGNGFNYDLGGTFSRVTLDTTNNGYIYLAGLLSAIAQGTYNFVDQSQNTADQVAGVFPENRNHSYSQLWQLQASVNKDLFSLPGGELNVAVTGQYRNEKINNPSANDTAADPTQRYYGINAVGVIGQRHVWSAGYEITAPILSILKVKAEGSYDKYSTGPKRFSPKFEAELHPIEQIKFRGTFSKGFRIPSFAESFALPTTGYVSASIVCKNPDGTANPTYAAFCAAHANNPSYYAGTYSYGLTSSGNRNLDPEKSTGYTFGAVITPVHNITMTIDYFRTKLANVIIPATVTADVITQYYTNNGVVNVPGITVTPGTADPNNPGALPLLGFAGGSYENADSFLVRGVDASISAKFPLTAGGLKYQTIGNVSRLLRLQQTNADGSVSRYDGTLGPCNITSCSGAPHWRATWQNTLDFNGRGNVTLTAYYTSGYSSVATDSGGVYGDCAASAANGQLVVYGNGDPVQCRAKSVFYMDGHAEVKVKDQFTFYVDVKNLLDKKPDYEPNAAYGLYQFNPAWSDSLFIGRFFRFGAKVDF